MNPCRLSTTISTLSFSHGGGKRRTYSGLRLWWPIATASMLVGTFVFAAVARSQSVETKVQTRRDPPPYWAYAVDPPADASDAQAQSVDNTPRHVSGSAIAFAPAQIGDLFNVPDWHPDNHPAMPEVVAHGRTPDVFACGYCHLPNGQGRPENSSLAGLPVGYILQQIADFKDGLRKTSEPRHRPIAAMRMVASKASESEVQAAAQYFSGLKPRQWIRVVETKTVPKTRVSGWMLVPLSTGGTELINHRIIETPENLERTELRDDTSGFIAYVPVGSIKKGEALVISGGAGKTIQCTICHGPDLKGLGDVPPILGRSPSYIVRQLCDIKRGERAGVASQLMRPVVARLSVDDMASIAAYAASLSP